MRQGNSARNALIAGLSILLGIAIFLYVLFPALLDRIDGTPPPVGALPGSLVPIGVAALPTRFLDRPGGRLAYDDSGTAGPLVICVPSLGDLRQEYRALTPLLVAAGFRVVTLDLRGQGESSTGWADYSIAALGGDIVALATALDTPAFVIGTSISGGAAVWAAAEAPERIVGQILIDPFVRDYPVGTAPSRAEDLLLDATFAGPWGVPAWSLYYRSLYPGTPPADFAAYRGVLKANLREPGRFTAVRAYLAASKTDAEARLGAVRTPTLVVMGTRDPDFPDPTAEAGWLAAQLGAQSLLVEGAGHYPHAERPQAVAPAIIAFLRAGGARR